MRACVLQRVAHRPRVRLGERVAPLTRRWASTNARLEVAAPTTWTRLGLAAAAEEAPLRAALEDHARALGLKFGVPVHSGDASAATTDSDERFRLVVHPVAVPVLVPLHRTTLPGVTLPSDTSDLSSSSSSTSMAPPEPLATSLRPTSLVDVVPGVSLVDRQRPSLLPLLVDFGAPAVTRRVRDALMRNDPLLKAVGWRRDRALSVLDTTGGLGRDAFLLASAGARVAVLERNPVIACLLFDGLLRAQRHRDAAQAAELLRFRFGDAADLLRRWTALDPTPTPSPPSDARPRIVYVDAMFPGEEGAGDGRGKEAAADAPSPTPSSVKREAQFLVAVCGPGREEDTTALVAASLAAAEERVVVKLPRTAPELPPFTLRNRARTRSYVVPGRAVRFDVYAK